MSNFFARLLDHGQTPFPPVPALSAPAIQLEPKVATSAVGAAVRAFDKSYQAQLSKRMALETQIAGLQEDLRQTVVIIASIEAAMTVASADPALSTDEKATAEAAVSNRVTIEARDLSHG